MTANIENLKQRLQLIVQACEDTQGALRVVEDRVDGAMIALTAATDSSEHDAVTTALSELGKIKAMIEQQIASAKMAADAVATYRFTR